MLFNRAMRFEMSPKSAKWFRLLYRVVLLVVFLMVFLLLFDFRRWYWQGNFADSAYFQDIARQIAHGSWFGSHFGGSITADFRNVILNPNAHSLGQIPDVPLDSNPSQFYNHAYLIMIPIAAFTAIFNYRITIDSLLVLLTLIPFIMLIFALRHKYQKEYKKRVILLGLLFGAVLMCFPGINFIALGQFYPDRLIIFFLPLTMVAIENFVGSSRRKNITWLVIFAILSLSVTERGSLYVALVAFGMLFFRCLQDRHNFEVVLRRDIPILLIGFGALAWTVIYISRISQNVDTIGFGRVVAQSSLKHNQFITMTSLKLVLLCLPILLIVSKYLDLLCISAISLLPNMLGTYLFNLKTAWVAHYMSYLTATLLGALLIAIIRDSERSRKRVGEEKASRYIPVRAILAACMAVLSAFLINPVSETKLFEPSSQIRLGTFSQAKLWWSDPANRQITKQIVTSDYNLAGEIPANSSVVTTELTAPFINGRVKTMDYYPINLQSDDYVLIFSTGPVGQPFVASPVTSYASPTASLQMTSEATTLLNSDCYEVVDRVVGVNLYLFHRTKVISDESACQPRVG